MLLLYLRIFAINTAMRYLIYFGIAFQVLFYLAYFAVYLAVEVLCVSIESLWTSFCADNWKFVLVQGTVNVVTDFYVLCLPTAMVMQLQLTVTGKLKLISIFMTGLLYDLPFGDTQTVHKWLKDFQGLHCQCRTFSLCL